MSDKSKIYDYIKRTINPYGKPFKGTAYELGFKIMAYIENMDDEKENGWIPVSERLPEEMTSTNYLVTIKGYGVDIANYVPTTKTWYCLSVPCEVIAWKPLSEPMKEDDV